MAIGHRSHPTRRATRIGRAFAIYGVVAILLVFTTGTGAAERNCDDFTRQSDGPLYFTTNGGSTSSSAEGLDGDRDGIACEALSKGKVRRFLHTVAIHPFLTIAALIPEIAAVAWLIHIVRRAKRQDPAPEVHHFDSPYVPGPEAREVPVTGLLALTVLKLPTDYRSGLTVDSRMPNTYPVIEALEVDGMATLSLSVGIWTVELTSNGKSVSQVATAGIVTDDVMRLDLIFDPDSAAQPPVA